ncbi:MAG TPA: pilus assembly protein TadG-related protein [Candidatus Aquilonibacter sp.]|nr:pilus assembly protein TadG-related protein [Candidatus Aquilonibacter sp.]
MRPPLIRRPQSGSTVRQQERGVTIALVALAIFSIIAMAGLSIDVGTLYQASAEAQRAADAAALAAARTLSTSGMTGDPANSAGQWGTACSAATQVAQTVASQNTVGGAPPGTVAVSFISGDQQSNCAATTAVSFGVNPTVTVQVTQTNLPTFFAQIWGRSGNTVSATATAEAFNPSNSGVFSASGGTVPVQPRCVKPMIIPNQDPVHPTSCTGPITSSNPCNTFVTLTGANAGSITNGGIEISGGGSGVIGESFNLIGDCDVYGNGGCYYAVQHPPQANGWPPIPTPNLDYLPGTLASGSVAVPSCATANPYQAAIAGCDQTTQYQCGVQYSASSNPNTVDLPENPNGVAGDTATAAACLINQNNGQDSIDEGVYPYQIKAGAGNPLTLSGAVASGTVITNSDSIVTLPIYDDTQYGVNQLTGNSPVTIVGFLQVFIQSVSTTNGSLAVTVMNIAACGNNVSGSTTPVHGTSPVPVRLITPP